VLVNGVMFAMFPQFAMFHQLAGQFLVAEYVLGLDVAYGAVLCK